MVKKLPGRKWPNGHSQNRRFGEINLFIQNRRFGEINLFIQNRRFGEIVYYFEILDYRAIRMFTPALVLVIGGADEIYGVALL